MPVSMEQLNRWLLLKENEHLEFKEAKNNFHFESIVKYCAALANEGGGSIVLGVTDKQPRRIVGTSTFQNIEHTKAAIVERLRLRIEATELQYPTGRVVVFSAPSRPIGVPIVVDGAYWMRAGESLVPMTPDMLQRIFAEAGVDFSSEICPNAQITNLDHRAIGALRTLWSRKAKNPALKSLSDKQLLHDAELITSEGITYAAIVLLGAKETVRKYLAQAESVFEYRSSETAGPAQQREEFCEGFLLYYDRLWELVNLRNEKQHYQDGIFMLDIPTFSEGAIREIILNAVAHRDYRLAGSIFIRQYPQRIEIVSPGGFPQGITKENILERQQPRNRRIADTLSKCGFVERAGQGANRIYEECIRESKALPDFTNTDAWQVSLVLHGQVRDPQFVRFLERLAGETNASFDTHDFLVMDYIHKSQTVPEYLKNNVDRLVELGAIERIGRGRGSSLLLSRRFYAAIGRRGEHTRRKGLDRETNKSLLLKHIHSCKQQGCALDELCQVLPNVSRSHVQTLLRELRADGEVCSLGERRWTRWIYAQEKKA